MHTIAVVLMASLFLISAQSSAETMTKEQLTRELVGSWLVAVANEGRTRLLKISDVSQGSGETYSLTAVYGWSDGNQSSIKAEFIQDQGGKKLSLVTPANTIIIASQDSSTAYTGTFVIKNGDSKLVRITKMNDEQLNDKMLGFEKPDGMVPEKCAAFFGIWRGSWSAGSFGEQTLKIRKVVQTGGSCVAMFTYGDTTSDPKNFSQVIINNQDSISFLCNRSTGGTCTFTVHGDQLWANYSNPGGGTNSGVFKKQQ